MTSEFRPIPQPPRLPLLGNRSDVSWVKDPNLALKDLRLTTVKDSGGLPGGHQAFGLGCVSLI